MFVDRLVTATAAVANLDDGVFPYGDMKMIRAATLVCLLTGCSRLPMESASTNTAKPEPTEPITDADSQHISSPETTTVAPAAEESHSQSADQQPVEIVFEDIQLPIQEDVVFRPFMLTDRVRELDGRRIRIHGYMLPDSKTKGIKQFVLLKNTECKFGPGGQADHLLNVLMVEGESADFRDEPIFVEGILTVNPFQGPDGNTWSIYDLACDRVAQYRPRR